MSVELDPGAELPAPHTRVPLTFERILLAAAMGAMALITAANVVTRYLSNVSLAFTEEYSVVLMVVVALVGSALAIACGRHIRIAYFTDMLSPANRRPLASNWRSIHRSTVNPLSRSTRAKAENDQCHASFPTLRLRLRSFNVARALSRRRPRPGAG